MLKTLYIIGNGFDLHHGIKSRYADFRKYCEEQDEEMVKRLKMFHENPEKLWSDFEAEMGNIDADKQGNVHFFHLQDISINREGELF